MVESILKEIAQAQTMARLWRLVRKYFRDHGFGAGSYYLLRTASNQPAAIPSSFGYSREFKERYTSLDFQKLDVVPRRVIALGKPMSWSDIWDSLPLSPEEQEFRTTMREVTTQPGVAFPCYGPRNRNACVTLSKFEPGVEKDQEYLRAMQSVAQAAHMRMCEFFEYGRDSCSLSSREKEILGWVAYGKSNSVIAEILQISPDTVDTYMRRIYRKFEVYDRTSAAIKGVGMGLIAA